MTDRRSRFGAAALLAALPLLAAGGAGAQEPGPAGPVEVVVEHIAGSIIYVPAGRDRGLQAGDTLRVTRPDEGAHLGLLVVVAVTDARSSLAFAGAPFSITRGDRLLLHRLEAGGGAAALAQEAAAAEREARSPRPRTLGPADGGRAAPEPLVVHGSVGVDVDAFRATSRWGGPGVDRVERAVTTPALRLDARATGLPLGLEAAAHLRAAYRSSSDTTFGPARSIRVYEASLGRRFTGVPLEVRGGRFRAPSSALRSFWDGAMVRFGTDGWGLGGAAGYEPARGDEGFSTDIEKWSAFADYRHRSRGLSYSTDIGFLAEHAPADGWSRRTVGWAQRARWGALFVSSRAEWDLDPPDGGDPLSRAFADVGLALGGGIRLEGGYARDALRWRSRTGAGGPGDLLPPVMERWSAGAAWAGAALSASLRAGRIREGNGREATSVDGSVYVAPVGRSGLSGGLVATYWDDGALSSLFVSPFVSRSFGPVDARLGYQYYATSGADPLRMHGGDVALDFPLHGGLSGRLSAQANRDDGLTTLRTYTGLRVRF